MSLKFESCYLLTQSVHIQVGRVSSFFDNSRARWPGIVYGFSEEYSPLLVADDFLAESSFIHSSVANEEASKLTLSIFLTKISFQG